MPGALYTVLQTSRNSATISWLLFLVDLLPTQNLITNDNIIETLNYWRNILPNKEYSLAKYIKGKFRECDEFDKLYRQGQLMSIRQYLGDT